MEPASDLVRAEEKEVRSRRRELDGELVAPSKVGSLRKVLEGSRAARDCQWRTEVRAMGGEGQRRSSRKTRGEGSCSADADEGRAARAEEGRRAPACSSQSRDQQLAVKRPHP